MISKLVNWRPQTAPARRPLITSIAVLRLLTFLVAGICAASQTGSAQISMSPLPEGPQPAPRLLLDDTQTSTPAPETTTNPSPTPATIGSMTGGSVPAAALSPTPAPAPAGPVSSTTAPPDTITSAPSVPAVVESPDLEPSPSITPSSTDNLGAAVDGAAALMASAAPAGDAEPSEREIPPSESVTINLINKLVERGILTKEDAMGMIKQAQAEAEVAQAQAQADMYAIAQIAATQAATQEIALAQAASGPLAADEVRVSYLPEPVRTQIKEDIKSELMRESHGDGKYAFGGGSDVPEWVNKFEPFMDMRFRYEGDFFPTDNDATGAFPNFNAINTGSPYDVTGLQFAPQYNVDADRNRFRLRLRFGAEMDLAEGFTAGVRVATGDSNSPVSTNQSIGLAGSGQGGQFSKYALWLDRGFLRWEGGSEPDRSIVFSIGRFDSPFFSTPVIWDDDLGFDGVAVAVRYRVSDWLTPFATVGAFPVYNTDFNFSTNQPSKFASYDKYLYGGQLGFELKPDDDWKIKVAGSYYAFQNIEGQLSTPYTPLFPTDAGDTDSSRPSFAQKGNTYMPLRRIIPDASNDFGASNQWQYYGLATKFQQVAATARIDYNGFEPVQVSLVGEYVRNLAFDKADIEALAVNNRAGIDELDPLSIGKFDGSPDAWLVELRVGTPALAKQWDWQASFGYRWIGSDSVVDGFNDSDFGLGGTNMKGFTVGAALSISSNVWLGFKWLTADSIAGPTFKSDVMMIEVNSRF